MKRAQKVRDAHATTVVLPLESYTRREVSQSLRISLRMVDILVASGAIRSFRVGRRRLISKQAVTDFIEQCEQATVNE